MRTIELTRGYYTTVDDEDYEYLNQFKWRVRLCKHDHRKIYAIRTSKSIGMHRVIMNITDPKIQVDHKDGNGLNNQKYNLRVATNQQNIFSSRKSNKKTSSIYKGVSYEKDREKWSSKIKLNYKSKSLGRFDNEIDAAKAYDVAARNYFGEFAKLNFPHNQENSCL